GRAINTKFVRSMAEGTDTTVKKCSYKCLKKCDHHYCISERLLSARDGNLDEGLFFSGANTYKMTEILPVAEIFRQFVTQAESVYKEGHGFSPAAS
ncbi:MAG: nitronate monooxygenase, partial [Proteobacteria bacterium]|nr:nitronate monooxygenase [Pseudomonadota bacterium]